MRSARSPVGPGSPTRTSSPCWSAVLTASTSSGRVIIALARGGIYSEGSPASALEHLETYLRGVFNFIGIEPESYFNVIALPEKIVAGRDDHDLAGRADHGRRAELAAEREMGERSLRAREVDQDLGLRDPGANIARDADAAAHLLDEALATYRRSDARLRALQPPPTVERVDAFFDFLRERLETARHLRVFPGEGAHSAELTDLLRRLDRARDGRKFRRLTPADTKQLLAT